LVSGADNADAQVEIMVTDTGIGVHPDHQERIFEPFFQMKGGTTDKTLGTGLGLSISKQLAEMHGGSIELESPGLGQGCTARFSLPIGAIDRPASFAPPENQAREDARAGFVPGDRELVLPSECSR
jgi:signal transduction histidine kinase